MAKETATDNQTDDVVDVGPGGASLGKASIVGTLMSIPQTGYAFVSGTVHLFCQRRFGVHRFTGMLYLVMFVLAVLGEFFPVILDHLPHLHVVMPITGCLQAMIATYTFKFLGKNANVQGYFSDKRTMSYDFVFENVFFSGLLAFQSLYFHQKWIFRQCPPLEALCVFFPYFTIRKLFPRTRLRDSISNDKEKSAANKRFINIQTWTSKIFMCFGKHVSGLLCNYLMFLDAVPEHHHRTFRYQFILGGWGTTIAMFLHTMKFKGYLGARTAILAYTLVFPLFYCVYVALFDILLQQYDLTALALGGLVVNFGPQKLQIVWQIGVYLYLRHLREGAVGLHL